MMGLSRRAHERNLPVATFIAVLFAAMLVLAEPASAQAAKYPPTIVFMTDFGVLDDSVAICRGVMYSIMPEVRIVDLTHQVTPFSILDGARFLYGASPYYPAGTVFVVVVDPTVGSTRKAIVAKSKRGQYFVLPDNGVITLVLRTHTAALATLFTASTIMPALLYAGTVLLYVLTSRGRGGGGKRGVTPTPFGRWELPIVAGALIWLAYELIILIVPSVFRDAQYYVLGALGLGLVFYVVQLLTEREAMRTEPGQD